MRVYRRRAVGLELIGRSPGYGGDDNVPGHVAVCVCAVQFAGGVAEEV